MHLLREIIFDDERYNKIKILMMTNSCLPLKFNIHIVRHWRHQFFKKDNVKCKKKYSDCTVKFNAIREY